MSEEQKPENNELSEEGLEQVSGGGSGDPLPTESISFNYLKATPSASKVYPKIDMTIRK